MKKLILVRGCSGAGKSTFAGLLSEYVISADDYFMVHGEYKFDATRLHLAHQYSFNTTEISMSNEVDQIVVANTFTTEKDLAPYIALAANHGYTVFSVIVENRHGGTNIHNVPVERVKKQEQRLRGSIKLS